MPKSVRIASGQTHSELANDGCVSTDRAAQLATNVARTVDPYAVVSAATVRRYARTGVIEPTSFGNGRGHFARYDLRDVAGLGTIALARAQGASLQCLRKVQPRLRALGKEWSNSHLLVFRRGKGKTDVLLAETPEEGRTLLRSLLEVPDQVVIAQVALHNVSDELRTSFAMALRLPPAKRGRVLGKSYPQSQTPEIASTSRASRNQRAARSG